jgi:2-octaprenyl-6-methoxyphenol hydroxylase
MDEHDDIVMIGAGLVGAGFLAALRNSDFRITVLETHVPGLTEGAADSRPLSLTCSSQRILDTLGLWTALADSAAPMMTVHVSEQSRFGVLRFSAAEAGVPALGYVVSSDSLQTALYEQAAQNPRVRFVPIQQLTGIEHRPENHHQVSAQTINGEKIFTAELIVAADGAHSTTRELAGIKAREQASGEFALTLELELSQPHQQTAYERFTREGVIALLPLRDPHRCRAVWILTGDTLAQVQAASDAQLAQSLRAAMNERLGDWRIVSRGKAFPLETVMAQEQIRPGLALLGNAAHTLYPLAAQGFNLGLRDAATLAQVLVDARQNHQAIGDESVLQRYVDWRLSDQRWISGLTSGVSQLFGCHLPGLGLLRGAGLLAADLLPPLKRRLAQRLMGLAGKAPKLARGIPL